MPHLSYLPRCALHIRVACMLRCGTICELRNVLERRKQDARPPLQPPSRKDGTRKSRSVNMRSIRVQVKGIHGISMEHSCNIKRLFMEKKWNIYIYKINCISKEYFWYGDGLTMAIQWLYKDLIWKLMNMITISIVYPGNTYGMFWNFQVYTMVYPWVYLGYSMGIPLVFHGKAIEFSCKINKRMHGILEYLHQLLWSIHGYTIVYSWIYIGYSMDLLRHIHGYSMHVLLILHGINIPWIYHGY